MLSLLLCYRCISTLCVQYLTRRWMATWRYEAICYKVDRRIYVCINNEPSSSSLSLRKVDILRKTLTQKHMLQSTPFSHTIRYHPMPTHYTMPVLP